MAWNLYKNKEFLKPLCFSNGKTQEDVVKEILGLIEQGKKIIFVHGVCGTGKCLDGNSLVFCKPNNEQSYSYYKISELVGKRGRIISLNKKGQLGESTFENVRKTGKKRLHLLKTRTGRDILASSNHPFLTITKKGLEWVSLDKLNSKSYVCLPNQIEINESINLDNNEVKIIAHLIAEGKLGDKAGSPKYYQCPDENPGVRKDYIDALRKIFPEGEIKENKQEVSIKFGLMDTKRGTTNKLRLFIRKYGLDGKKSGEKFIPKEIFGLNEEKISIFLSRLFSCDGSIYKRNSGQIVIEYDSISKKLIYDVSILLQQFKIQHTITTKKFRENKEYSFRISISESKNLKKYIERIGFIGRKSITAKKFFNELKENKFTNIDKVPRIIREYIKSLGYSYLELDRFLNYKEIIESRQNKNFREIIKDKVVKTPFVFNQQKIDFLRQHIREINKQIQDETLSFVCSEDILWDKVKSISYSKEDETYDLEVPENHNFIVNGIIAHNSAIALNIASKLGKSSIVVPGKNLQAQYKRDYEEDKYLLKENGEKLKISIITGRGNHRCKFLEDNIHAIPKIRREMNAKLNDLFSGVLRDKKENEEENLHANNPELPCNIEIRERNWLKIKKYIGENKKVDPRNFSSIKDVKRMSVAPACPYWSPVLPEKYEIKTLGETKKRRYEGLDGNFFSQYKRKPGCPFYEQFDSYIDSDVIVFNSLKYKLETALLRKPKTEVEIIDECDEFLDSFSNERTINLERLNNSLIQVLGSGEGDLEKVEEIFALLKHFEKDERIMDARAMGDIIPLKSTGIYDILKIFLKKEWLDSVDDESYLFDVLETAKMFEEFMDESYTTFEKREKGTYVNIVTTNLAKKLNQLIEKNKTIVLMSGTLHSKKVLEEIFGLKEFDTVDAETESQGRVEIKETGLEMDCKYSNFSKEKFTRENYLLALDKCVDEAPRPTLVHINAFMDLPSEFEIKEYSLQHLIPREEIREMQIKDKKGGLTKEFKEGEREILFSTRDSRGVDFPGNECRSIIFTKYPNPNVQNPFWKILMKNKPHHYWDFYKDKARREFLQKIYRGLRFKEDYIYLLSPDTRVLDMARKEFS